MARKESKWKQRWERLPSARQWRWFAGLVACVVALVVGIGIWSGARAVVHQSDTNPQLCAGCHIMRDHVESYTNGTTLDSVHARAGVECKECHDYGIPAELRSGINFLIGNYSVTKDGALLKRTYGDEMCVQCHIGMDYLAIKTDHLMRNPHLSHIPDLLCSDCHVSHGPQINYCGECHDNGGQRMTGGDIFPRAENPWADPSAARPAITPEKLPGN